ncbi:hypothetical protein TSUD_60180 [Trifolium subterraneum]|uniref:Xyloglucan endotransglucosylase/hydrolase n=1 Tax=Trifolium subterraneum TaxID=3900 RepID=A0A2Z6MYI3_TRISU|nr:hypothetical protein TSUD_60180 [Trifolium subterraneum]
MLAAIFIFAFVPNIIHVKANFSKSMYLTWGVQHASIIGEDLHLVLDKSSGSAARSKRSFLFGSIEMLIKLIPGNSAGVVTAYYLSSEGSQHDEIDFEFLGISYPNKQGMRVYTSLWNADNWATRGGLVKTDWSNAPFKVDFHRFRARACKWNGAASINQCASYVKANWWTSSIYKQLSYGNVRQLIWVRKNFMTYDYCKDYKRFNGHIPHECFKTHF